MHNDFLQERTLYYFVYALVNTDTGVAFYVGQSKSPRLRLRNHLSSTTKHSRYVLSSRVPVDKVGMVILCVCPDLRTALSAEGHFIARHYPTLTNPDRGSPYKEHADSHEWRHLAVYRDSASALIGVKDIPFADWSSGDVVGILDDALCLVRGSGFTHDGVLMRWQWDVVERRGVPRIECTCSKIDDSEVLPCADEPYYLEGRHANIRRLLRHVSRLEKRLADPNDSPWWRGMQSDTAMRGSFRIPGTTDALVVGRIPNAVAERLIQKYGSVDKALLSI
jgi:predicted GIY-YIG superfamily endonuclease